MKKIVLSVLFLFPAIMIFAQQSPKNGSFKIKGSLIDSASRQPLEYATISLFPEGAKKATNGAVTDSKGNFEVKGIPAGTFKLVAEFIGYQPRAFYKIHLDKNHPLVKLKNIQLQQSATTLQNIKISGKPKIIENKIDRLIFNADQDVTSQVGVATDVLKKVPQVSVDVDGNVELAGNSSIRFLIDGKPSSAFGSNIADVLQAIPASQIKSIEVITSPGAKYDAQGLGGIINIILKKNNSQGVNGNLSLSGGTRNENGSFNFNVRKGSFGMHAYVSADTPLSSVSTSSLDRITNDTTTHSTVLLNQNGSNTFTRGGYQTGLGFDWDLNKHNSLSGSVSYNHFNHIETSLSGQSQITKSASGDILSQVDNSITNDHTFHFRNMDAGLNYKKTFKKEDQELDLAMNSSFGNGHLTITAMSICYLQIHSSSVQKDTIRERKKKQK